MSTQAHPTAGPTTEQPPARTRRPDRGQLVMICGALLDDAVPPDHPVRVVWAAVERLDLARFYAPIAAREGPAGRPATDPRVLYALWLQAAADGVAGGRRLADLCERHAVYRWPCGGVPVSYHTLNDFRVGHREALDESFTQVLGRLAHAGLASVRRVAQDGTKVRASAGSGSFKGRPALERALAEARAHVAELGRLAEESPAEASARARAAQERAAADRAGRVARALAAVGAAGRAEAGQKEKPSKHAAARASTTGPDARLMRTPDGGCRPAYNVRLAQDAGSRAIAGVAVTGDGNDRGQPGPMRDQVRRRAGRPAEEHLYDGGTLTLADVGAADAQGVTVCAPVPAAKRAGRDRHEPRPGDGDAVARWRRRMATAEARAVYKLRAAVSETANADLKAHRGLDRVAVRGAAKVLCVALWAALAYNLMHFGRALVG